MKISEKYLKTCLDRVWAADPTGQDLVIKDLNKRVNRLVKAIRELKKRKLN